nr:unnamed protein product [Naegleria fowleri]
MSNNQSGSSPKNQRNNKPTTFSKTTTCRDGPITNNTCLEGQPEKNDPILLPAVITTTTSTTTTITTVDEHSSSVPLSLSEWMDTSITPQTSSYKNEENSININEVIMNDGDQVEKGFLEQESATTTSEAMAITNSPFMNNASSSLDSNHDDNNNEKRISEVSSSTTDSRKSRASSCMKNHSRSIYEMFVNGELGDDLQDDGDDRFKANSNRRKQLATSWQTLTQPTSNVTIRLDPKLIEQQIERKQQALEQVDLTKMSLSENGHEYKFPNTSNKKNTLTPSITTTTTSSGAITTTTLTRKRSTTDPVHLLTTAMPLRSNSNSCNSSISNTSHGQSAITVETSSSPEVIIHPMVSMSPLNSPTDEEGTKPLCLSSNNSEIIHSPPPPSTPPTISPSSSSDTNTINTINTATAAAETCKTLQERIHSEQQTSCNDQKNRTLKDDLVLDGLPSAYNIVTKKPRRIPSTSSKRKLGYTTTTTTNRPNSLSLTFNTVSNLNASINNYTTTKNTRMNNTHSTINNTNNNNNTKEPTVRMRSIHRNSVVSNKSVTTEPYSEFENFLTPQSGEFHNKCFMFDLFCSVKVVLCILFIATIAMSGLIIWLSSYLMLEFQVIPVMATSSNEDITSLLKYSWTSLIHFAPYILTNTRSVMTGLHGNLTIKEVISNSNNNHLNIQRKLFAQMLSRSMMFNQIFAVDLSGSYVGVVMDLSSGMQSFIMFNNTNNRSIYFSRMQDGNLIPGTEMEITNFEDPTSNSTFLMMNHSLQKLVELDLQRLENGLAPLETSVWSSIYYIKSSGEYSISCIIPYYSGKVYSGFISLSFSIRTLSDQLKTQTQLDKGHRAFIIRKDGVVLGSSHGLSTSTADTGSLHDEDDHHVQDSVVSSITQQLFKLYGTYDPMYQSKVLNVSHLPRSMFLRDLTTGSGHYVTVESLSDDDGGSGDPHSISTSHYSSLDWIIIHSTPKDIVSTYLGLSNVIILIVTLVLIVISSGVSLLVSALISRPLGSLKRRVDRMAQLNFKTKDESVPVMTFSEVRSIITSVNNMGKGLRSFSKYVPSEIVASIVQSNQPAALGVQWKVITLYFSDIASFTNMTEKMSPDLLVELMCDFFTHQTDIIMSTKGTIDKFIGDSIMAFWNDPIPIRDHELAAVESAYLCQQALVPFNNRWREKLCSQKNRYNVDYSNFTLKVRIGLHTGECFIGNIGSVDRMNYTCIGDAVNTSSRLESLNSMYGTSIMISENVYAKVHRKFLCKWVDVVCVKGKAIPINIYSVIEKKEHASSEAIKMCAAYQALREMFLNLRFEEAIEFIETNEDILSYMSESKEKASYQLIKKKCMERMDLDLPESEEDLFWIATKLNEK